MGRLLRIPRSRAALIRPLAIEQWLKALKSKDDLANPTLAKTRNVMSLVFRHGIRHSLIQGGEGSNPLQYVRCRTTSDYESMTIEPHQAFAIWRLLPEPERLLLLLAACTGVRVSEGLGLQWGDLDFGRGVSIFGVRGLAERLGLPRPKPPEARYRCTIC